MTSESIPAPGTATYDDLVALPEHVVGEIIDGELHISPRPAPRHTSASSNLGMVIGSAFRMGRGGPGGWWILDEPELHLRKDVVVPDLAGWRTERLPALPATAFFTLAPDWVCEVLSPGNARWDRGRKLRVYAKEGIPWCWLVDPIETTIEALELRDGRYTLATVAFETRFVRIPPFEAIEIDLAELFGEAPPPHRVSEAGAPASAEIR